MLFRSAVAINAVAIGHKALKSAATQAGTVMIGHKAGELLIGGDHNIGIGFGALGVHVGGSRNIVIGYGAMGETDGSAVAGSSDNIFIGQLAGGGDWNNAGVSDQNVGIGSYALMGDLNQSHRNSALGFEALKIVTSGDDNVAIGANAGDSITTGSNNTLVGSGAGATMSADQNTCVGYYSGNLISTGNFNTCIGQRAGDGIAAGQYNTLLGYEADVDGSGDSGLTRLGAYGIMKYYTIRVTCDQGGTDENDPSHTVAIGKIPQFAVITKAAAVLVTKNSQADHSLKLVLSSDSSGTDNTALNDVQEIIGAGASNSWSATGGAGAAADINCATGAVEKTAYVAIPYDPAGATNSGLAAIDTVTEDTYVYLAFADGSFTGSDAAPSASPVVKVMVEYIGLD